MNQFEQYLKTKKYRKATIAGHIDNVKRFVKWSTIEKINYKLITYNELLRFINSAHSRNILKGTINNYLQSIDNYMQCLMFENVRNDNPCRELRLKNKYKKVAQNLLSPDELDRIYLSFITLELSFLGSLEIQLRNNVILGLLIYQGLRNKELQRLEVKHINLTLGTIYIPSTHRINSRTLKLNAVQILPLQHYIKTVHVTQEELFICSINAVIFGIIKCLRSNNSNVFNALQIRKSVIVNWLKTNNIRQVQYMLGHKHISSTEEYKSSDVSSLRSALEHHHPMK
jgi:integrase/recombinase XerD